MPESRPSSIWLHRLAVSTVCVALITLTFGALVTSKNAGMAFADWPTSDGYLMVTYPWLGDFAKNWDKFLEHGHRLAGMLIGIWSIVLVVVTWNVERRGWVKKLSLAILIGVICQGLLGGFRVQLNERGLAMLHGIFAALVFSLMGMMVLVTGVRWKRTENRQIQSNPLLLKLLAGTVLGVTFLQYALGSLIRHQGLALHEHRGLGILLVVLAGCNLVAAARSRVRWLRHGGQLLFAVVLGQVGLGFATWFAKYGMPSLGYVATADSILQVSLRTSHMVWGTVVMMTALTYFLRVIRASRLTVQIEEAPLVLRPSFTRPIANGGAR